MPEQGDSGLDRLIESLYGCVVEQSDTQFMTAALERLCQWCGAGAGAWLLQTVQGQRVDFAAWPAPIAPEEVAGITFPDGQRSGPVTSLAADWRIDGRSAAAAEGFHLMHRGTAMHSTVLLLFADTRTGVDDALRRALGHLVQAASLSLLQLVQRDEWLRAMGRHSRGSAALVDEQGRVALASRRFFDLLPDAPGEGTERRLPFPLPAGVAADGTGEFTADGLHFRVQRRGGLLLINARRPHPLDALSAREQQIARALAAGKTFKSIAREYDIAISTVANHASRIYRKLGLYRREELVGLLRKAA
ncbi:MAG: LuxR C-terminal-related transcriptional regulator [Sinimarinibacterium flocculans]|uniref:helix-turn-helix transcriptional regulator n=1 Tax=Sinimarinibacterium flocculans TaxID=985250 RepID=UPI003C414F79